MEGESFDFGVFATLTSKPAKAAGTVTSNWAARFFSWCLAARRNFQFIFRSIDSVCDESRMAFTFSAESAWRARADAESEVAAHAAGRAASARARFAAHRLNKLAELSPARLVLGWALAASPALSSVASHRRAESSAVRGVCRRDVRADHECGRTPLEA